jgi:predicted short-subunit dehydrogenase-like oxidoreductase (DUF2520 family)
MSDIAIIGAGKVGTTLGYALSRKSHTIKALVCKSISSAKESQKMIGQGKIFEDITLAASQGQWIVLSVPDDEIEKTARELATSDIEWEGRFVFHCSGLLSTESLKHLEKKGAWAASIHPIQSFPQKKPSLDAFQGIYFGLEGKGKALDLSKKIVRQLEGQSIILESQDKPLYHVACSMASNFFVSLLDAASFLLGQIGRDENGNVQILLPLVQGTLQNVKNFNTQSALTGPILRGDEKSIQSHLTALQKFPFQKKLYQELGTYMLRIVEEKKKLPPKKIRS